MLPVPPALRSRLGFLAIAPLALAAWVWACGSSRPGDTAGDASASDGPTLEASRPFDSGAGSDVSDGAIHDGGVTDSSDASDGEPFDASAATLLLQAGTDLALWGLTSDDYVVFRRATTLQAIPLDGGVPVTITQLPAGVQGGVRGKEVFVWSQQSGAVGAGTLTVWTSAAGTHVLSASAENFAVFNADGTYALYYDHYDPVAGTADSFVAKTDGTGATLLRSAVPEQVNGCYPFFEFVGSFVEFVDCPADAGAGENSLTTFAVPSWTSQVVFSNGDIADFDLQGTQALFANAAGLQVAPLSGGNPVVIDPAVTGGTGTFGLFTADDTAVVYVASGAFKRVTLGSSSGPMTLVPTGIAGITYLSLDGRSAQLFENAAGASTGYYDIYLASAVAPGSVIPLWTQPTGEPWGFTRDSLHTEYTTNDAGVPAGGTLMTRPIAPSGTAAVLGTNSRGFVSDGNGAALVFEDNESVTDGGTSPAWADIEWVDTSQGAPPTRIADQALPTEGYSYFYLSAAHDRVVFERARPSGDIGLFVTALP